MSRGYRLSKRAFDFTVALVLLAILFPVGLVVAVLIWRNMGTPILFRQARPGLNAKIFNVFKFRTMLDAYDAEGEPRPDAERLTSLGGHLRRLSLDELPQLLNVLRGEMSLVGPRPLLVEYLPLYSSEQGRRHNVLPGITGLAQVSGRNALPWEQRLELDVWYVDHATFLLDLKILAATVVKVLARKGISEPGQVSMSKFLGEGGRKSDADTTSSGNAAPKLDSLHHGN